MKNTLLIFILLLSACKKEEQIIQPTPTPIDTTATVDTITVTPPLPDKIFSVRMFDTINESDWSNALGWNHLDTFNITTNGIYASAIDQYWLQENDTIAITGKFKPAFPYDTIYAYIKRWDSLADTVPIQWKDTVIVNSYIFSYTYIYN